MISSEDNTTSRVARQATPVLPSLYIIKSDDSSMALATLDSIREIGMVAPEDIMLGFVNWFCHGEYTPFGKAFDQGIICSQAIQRFEETRDWRSCGSSDEWSNGNGGLMRILPVCLHFIEHRICGSYPGSSGMVSAEYRQFP